MPITALLAAALAQSPSSPTVCNDKSLKCPAFPNPSDLSVCDRDDNACGNCWACAERFFFATVPGLPDGYGFASRKALNHTASGGLKLSSDKRAYLVDAGSNPSPQSWADVSLVKLDLNAHTVSMKLDMSAVPCACNAAAYLVNMNNQTEMLPNSARGAGPVYCDIQGPTSSVLSPSTPQLCLEDDLVEGNVKAFQSTLHTSFTHPGPGQGANCDDCDQWGWKSCANGMGTFLSDRFGIGASTIDSSQPFGVTASYSDAASKFIQLEQSSRTLGLWNDSFVQTADCKGKAVPPQCYDKLRDTFGSDGMAMVLSLWKDFSTNMSWLNGACDGELYPVCDLPKASFVVESITISEGSQASQSDAYGTCRLNIPWQCCYDTGMRRCTKPSDGSQYCYESAKNCLQDCGGKEFCHCHDPHGAGCDKSWFVPGASGTDAHEGVDCQSSPEDLVEELSPERGPCLKDRAVYPSGAMEC
jgi:hypothetical protein